MSMADDELLTSLVTVFKVLPNLFPSDAGIAVSNKEKVLLAKQAESFKVNVNEGSAVTKDELTQRAIKSRKKESARFPKEVFGFPILAYCIPVINPDTNNVVGTINMCVSLEKENQMVEMAEELQAFSEELSASSEELRSSTEEFSDNSKKTSNFVNETQEGLKSMDGIIQYIKSVADTTNLLGLNAAIEAARAGEQGRGFSVVAGEIRKLATSSKDSTAQINNTLIKIQENINGITVAINEILSSGATQSAQAAQISDGSQRLTELASKLLNFSENII